MSDNAISLEKEAQNFLAAGDPEKAHELLKKAGVAYRREEKHRQAALCFASAASVWGKVYGDKSFYASAQLYEEAAKETQAYEDYDYAALLYRYAAINYERDGEFERFSDCFYNAKDSRRRALMYFILHDKSGRYGMKAGKFLRWLAMSFSCLVWGYGERPFRTLATGITVIVLAAVCYTFGGLIRRGAPFDPDFFEALYFSVATITTLGYGDISPINLSRPVAMLEAFCGIFIMPLFIVGLSRKYLRV